MKELFENYNNFCNYVIEANPNYDDESFTFEKFMDWYASLPYYSDGKGHSQGDNKKYMKIEKLSIGNLNQAELENRQKINEIVEAINLMSVGDMEEIINIQAPKKDYSTVTAPYYKVQEWDKKSLAWVDVQQSYETYQEAYDNGYGHQGIDFRIMKIQGNKRGVVGQP